MSDFKRIPIMVDAATGKQIDEFGSVVRDNDYFRLLFDETVILCCQFYDVNWIDGVAELNPHRVNPTLTFAALGDSDFDPTTPYMFLSEQSQDENNTVNMTGDWFNDETANPLDGQLSFRVDTNTERFAEALQNSSTVQSFYFCVTAVPSGQTATTVLAYFKFKAENRPAASTGSPVNSDPEYLNAQEVQALVKSAPIREFSIDGVTIWHSTQDPEDRYYREQRNGGEWSDAIALIEPTNAFTYVAYASDNTGTDFNLTPSDTLKYRAEIHVTEEIPAPAASDFSGATWVKYIGDKGDTGDNGTGVAPQGTYDSCTTYALNEGVTYNGSYYRSLTAANTGNQPDTSPTYWEKMVSMGDKGETGTNILTAISGFSYLFPDPDFTDYANTANIELNRGDYGADAALISTSNNEPMGYPLRKIPADAVSLKFREVFESENGYGWNGETVIFKGEFKKMTNNAVWSSVTSVDIGTFTAPTAETPTGDTTTDSAIITSMGNTSNLVAGMLISGSGIPAGATIISVDSGTQITISGNATATASTVSLTCKSTAPQLFESTVSLATLGLAVGDVVNFVQRVDSTSTWANNIAIEFAEIEVVTS